MPTIHGETGRGINLLPALSASQAVELLAAAALAWVGSKIPGPSPLRIGSATAIGVAGAVYVFGRWPLGPRGERATTWLRRIATYVRRPRAISGSAVPGWDGVKEIRDGWIRHSFGWSAVLELTGGGLTVQGAGLDTAVHSIYRELLHALSGSLQVVGLVRRLESSDRPVHWGPDSVGPRLTGVAQAYADHWTDLLATRAPALRRTLMVISVPGTGSYPNPDCDAAVAAVTSCLTRLGLTVTSIVGPDLIHLLRQQGGADDARPGPTGDASPLVVRRHA